MKSKLSLRWLVFSAPVLLCVGIALAESRTWTKSDKSKVEGAFVSSKDGKVVVKSAEGKLVTIPLKDLSEADKTYVKTEAVANAASQKAIRDLAQLFYADLRTTERTAARDALTGAAQELFKQQKSFVPLLPTPDKLATAIKVGRVKLDDDTAEVLVTVRVSGHQQDTTLHLRKEEDKWRAFAVSAKFGEDEKAINFETPFAKPEPGEKKDPLLDLVGKPIELEGITVAGAKLDMEQFKDKVVLVDFWATWCGPCRAEIPNILETWNKYHEEGFDVIAISVDSRLPDLQKFLAEEKPPWTVVVDKHPRNAHKMNDKFGISGIPAFILIGKDGKVAAVHCRGERLGYEVAKALGKTPDKSPKACE